MIKKTFLINDSHAEKVRNEAFTLSDSGFRVSESEIVRRALDTYFGEKSEKTQITKRERDK